MKALPHAAHWKGFSPVWIRRCFSGDELRPNALPHSVQPKGFPTASGAEGAKPLGDALPAHAQPPGPLFSWGLARWGAQGRAAADRGPRLTPPGAQGPGRSRALRTGPRASRVHMPPKAGTPAPLLSGPCATAPTSALSSAMTSLGPDSFISGLVLQVWASSVGSWATIPPAPTVTGDTQPGVGEKDDALRGRRTPCRKQAGRAHTPGRPSQAGHPASVPFNPPNTLKAGTTSTRPVSRMRKLRPKERSHSPTTAQLRPEHIRAHVLVAFQARAQTPVHAPAPAGWGATAPLPPPRPHSWVRVGPRPHQVPQLHPTPRMLAPRPTG